MSRATVLSGALVGVLWLVPVAHAKTWDVVFSGSGTSTASYHSDEWDRAGYDGETRCEVPEEDYRESATFSWTYRWTHVHLAGPRPTVADPRKPTSTGTETIHAALGPCPDTPGTRDCTYGVGPSVNASNLLDDFDRRHRGRRRFVLTAMMIGRSQHCTGDDWADDGGGPQPVVYSGFVKLDRLLTAADLAGTHTVTHKVTLTRRVLGAPLSAACDGKNCQITHCKDTMTFPYASRCSYTVRWKGTLRFIPRP